MRFLSTLRPRGKSAFAQISCATLPQTRVCAPAGAVRRAQSRAHARGVTQIHTCRFRSEASVCATENVIRVFVKKRFRDTFFSRIVIRRTTRLTRLQIRIRTTANRASLRNTNRNDDGIWKSLAFARSRVACRPFLFGLYVLRRDL